MIVGDTLSVRAAYTDAFGSTSAMRTSTNVVVVDLANRAPEFKNANDQVITSDTRSVPENSDGGYQRRRSRNSHRPQWD